MYLREPYEDIPFTLPLPSGEELAMTLRAAKQVLPWQQSEADHIERVYGGLGITWDWDEQPLHRERGARHALPLWTPSFEDMPWDLFHPILTRLVAFWMEELRFPPTHAYLGMGGRTREEDLHLYLEYDPGLGNLPRWFHNFSSGKDGHLNIPQEVEGYPTLFRIKDVGSSRYVRGLHMKKNRKNGTRYNVEWLARDGALYTIGWPTKQEALDDMQRLSLDRGRMILL